MPDSKRWLHPDHYQRGGMECLNVIAAVLGPEKYKGFLLGNVLKYLWRYPEKNGVEDLNKAMFYLEELKAKEGNQDDLR